MSPSRTMRPVRLLTTRVVMPCSGCGGIVGGRGSVASAMCITASPCGRRRTPTGRSSPSTRSTSSRSIHRWRPANATGASSSRQLAPGGRRVGGGQARPPGEVPGAGRPVDVDEAPAELPAGLRRVDRRSVGDDDLDDPGVPPDVHPAARGRRPHGGPGEALLDHAARRALAVGRGDDRVPERVERVGPRPVPGHGTQREDPDVGPGDDVVGPAEPDLHEVVVLPGVGRHVLDPGVEPDQGGTRRAVLQAAPGRVAVAAGRQPAGGVRRVEPVPAGAIRADLRLGPAQRRVPADPAGALHLAQVLVERHALERTGQPAGAT